MSDDTILYCLNDIHTNAEVAKDYIEILASYLPCRLEELFQKAQTHCPELGPFCQKNACKVGTRDKGSAGKLVEFHVFGRLPNSESTPDIFLGDIKCTHVKSIADGYNAKERLTLTNVGATSDYANLQHILDFDLEANPRWEKVRQGILVVMKHEEGKWTTQEKVLKETVMGFFHYDITSKEEWKKVIQTDYEKIRDCVRAKAASQRGQEYLHIHPHGSKNSSTRAFGFTNKFVTRLICHYTDKKMVESGKSLYFT
jgi:hypothetical protein